MIQVEWGEPTYVDYANETPAYITIGQSRVFAGRVRHHDDFADPDCFMAIVHSPNLWAPVPDPDVLNQRFDSLNAAKAAVEECIQTAWKPNGG